MTQYFWGIICQGHIESLSAKLEAVIDQRSAAASEVSEPRPLNSEEISEIEARVRAEVEAELEQKFSAAAAAAREKFISQQREIVAAIAESSLLVKRDYENKLQEVLDNASAEKLAMQEELDKAIKKNKRDEQAAAEHEAALVALQKQHEAEMQDLIEEGKRNLEEVHHAAAERQQRLAEQHVQALWQVEAELVRQRDNLTEAEKQFDDAQTTYQRLQQQQAQEFAQRMQLAEQAFLHELESQMDAKDLSANASLKVCRVTD